MADTLQLAAFVLPPTFSPELVPEACAHFVRDCVPRLTKRQLLARARARGWLPSWKPLSHLERDGLEAFGFALTGATLSAGRRLARRLSVV